MRGPAPCRPKSLSPVRRSPANHSLPALSRPARTPGNKKGPFRDLATRASHRSGFYPKCLTRPTTTISFCTMCAPKLGGDW